MTTLTASQLAFITKEKVGDTRKKMIVAWCKTKGLEIPVSDEEDPFPEHMPVELLSRGLNLPDLQLVVNDIKHNYLKRSATRQWIIEFPQVEINKKDHMPKKVSIPGVLKSLLSDQTIREILEIWNKRYGHFISSEGSPIKFE